MSSIYYKIQYKTEIERLNLYLKRSPCRGFLIPKRFFFKEDRETEEKKIDDSFLKSIETLNKEIILYKNYYNDRPYLINPQKKTLSDEIKEKLQKEFKFFVTNFYGNNLETYFKNEISESIQIINTIENYKNRTKSLIEESLFASHDNFKVSCFIIPFLPTIPINIIKLDPFFEELNNINEKAIDDLYNLYLKYSKIYNLENHIFMITLNLKDYLDKKYNINDILAKYKHFNKIGLWIVDFNEINATMNEIKGFYEIVNIFNDNFKNLFIFYVGIFSSRLINKINTNIRKIIRISGYPGLNINIPAIAPRTKRFYFQKNGKFYNDRGFSEELLSNPNIKYSCNCTSCLDFNIITLKRVFDIYFQNPTNVSAYNKFRERAKKTLENKLKARQNIFLMNHNFFNIDRQLHSNFESFTNEIFSTNLKINNWEILKKKKEDVEN